MRKRLQNTHEVTKERRENYATFDIFQTQSGSEVGHSGAVRQLLSPLTHLVDEADAIANTRRSAALPISTMMASFFTGKAAQLLHTIAIRGQGIPPLSLLVSIYAPLTDDLLPRKS